MRRAATWVAVIVALVAVTGLGAGGWYYSDQVLPVPAGAQDEPDVELLAVDPERGLVRIAATAGDPAELETVGLATDAGLLVLSGPLEAHGDEVQRRASLLTGQWPQEGVVATTAVDVFAGDPASTLGLPHDTVAVTTGLGRFPAWRVVPTKAHTDDLWVVLIHGRGASLSEGNRLLPVLDDLRLPSLTVSMRNDPDAPADEDGFGYYGASEWQEVAAALAHLREAEGAERFVLVGFSQGASVALSLLRHAPQADRVVGAALVSPLVSLDATLHLHARQRGIPAPLIGPLVTSTRWVARLRSGFDFSRVEHERDADELPEGVPLLVTHGDADELLPVEATRRFVEAVGDRIVYHEYAGVGHVREWNSDPSRFEADLRDFLGQTAQQDAEP